MKNLLKINGMKILSKSAQKQVFGGTGGNPGEHEGCFDEDPGIGNLCFNNSDCAHNQMCNIEGRCACGGSVPDEGCLPPNLCP